jgi:hypothetical protein
LVAESSELNNELDGQVVDELALVLTVTALVMLGERAQVRRLSARGFDAYGF